MVRPAVKTRDQALIIGGGPAGLATARALRTSGIPFTVFEGHTDVGGIWDIDNPGTPMYRSAHFISSKSTSGHEAFPMPDDFPDYPSNRKVLSYIRSFARSYGLYEHVRLGTRVETVRRVAEGWLVTSVTNGDRIEETYRWLVCASGTNWHPSVPSFTGEETFRGRITHSVDYKDAESLRGKRVLVVGAGNSGVDIACDAAFAAEQGFLSLRRGYHFVPKHIFGVPADVFGAAARYLPRRLMQLVFGLLLRLLNGDLTRLGLKKPDHRILESHPIINTPVLHAMRHGDLVPKPDIACLSGDDVVFTDGTRERIDLIILATGYEWRIPYLPPDTFTWSQHRPRAFLKIFHPKDATLFLNGFIETNSGAYKLFDEMGLLIAHAIEAQRALPAAARAVMDYVAGPEPDLGGGIQYVHSARHTGYTNVDAYRAAMRSMRHRFGWPSPEAFYGPPNSPGVTLAAPTSALGIGS